MWIAKRAAHKAAVPYISRKTLAESVIEDIAGDVVVAYLEIPEMERINDELSFELWCYGKAKEAMRSHQRLSRREVSADALAEKVSSRLQRGQYITGEDAFDILMSGSVSHRQRPMQEIHMEVKDAVKAIGMLPSADATLVLSIIDHGNVSEYAHERNISIFDAMSDLKRARLIMSRLRDDTADERRFGA